MQPQYTAKTCQVEGCPHVVRARNLCSTHHSYWLRHGAATPSLTPPTSLPNSLPGEEWRLAPGFEYAYMISNRGRFARWLPGQGARVGHVQRTYVKPDGYLNVRPLKDDIYRAALVHRLVALAFLGPRPIGRQINHKDGNKLNNAVSNLEYVTPKENVRHAFSTGLHENRIRGERHHKAKLSQNEVLQIRSLYGQLNQYELANRFGVNQYTIWAILHRRTWKDI